MPDDVKSDRRGLLWAIIGVVATCATGIPALYFTMKESLPLVVYEIVSESNVLDLHRSVENLDIMFRGENIRKANENLRLITLAIRNDGQVNVLQNNFDTTEPWGFKIQNGRLADTPRIVDSNSAYLRQKLRPILVTNDTAHFNKVILERGKFVSLDLLILHKNDQQPVIEPIGKIAGQEAILVTRRPPPEKIPSFWQRALSGSVWEHLVRFFLSILVLFVIIAVVFIIEDSNRKRKSRRRRKNEQFRSTQLEQHLSSLLSQISASERRFVLFIIHATNGDPEQLFKIQSIIDSQDVVKQLKDADEYLTELNKKAIGGMFRVQPLVPTALFEKNESGEYRVSDEARRIIPLLTDFLIKAPLPRDLLPKRQLEAGDGKDDGINWWQFKV